MRLLLLLFCARSFVSPLLILSPQHQSKHVLSPIMNFNFGEQDWRALGNHNPRFGNKQIVLKRFGDCQDQADDDQINVSGKYVLIVNTGYTRSIWAEEREFECWQNQAAVAIVRATDLGGVPGYAFYHNDPLMRNTVYIPVLHVVRQDVEDLVKRLEKQIPINVSLTSDPNPWKEEYWSTMEFTILIRIVGTGINVLAAFICAEAFVYHLHRTIYKARPTSRPQYDTARLMLFGSILECFACVIRASYLSIGPFFSSPVLSFFYHVFLMYAGFPLSMVTSVVAAVLCLRWGTFGTVKTWVRFRFDFWMFAIATISLILVYVMAILQGQYRFGFYNLELFTVSLLVAILLFTSVSFVCSGKFLIGQLQESIRLIRTTKGERSLKKSLRWICMCGFTQLIQCGAIGLLVDKRVMFVPWSNFTILALMFYSASLCGLTHAFAFRPVDESHTAIAEKWLQILSFRSRQSTVHPSNSKPAPNPLIDEPKALDTPKTTEV
eukprot:c10098_g1_i1.p1 GENE.c10098_g1_i1~~c10098_g1_i1.p1  ORF type:complete len:494 (+),score=103.95 c10098_g1_i1:60-1541(+)